ncbi:MAG: polysaccharide deacetylase family protein [Anaerolineales bacterium]
MRHALSSIFLILLLLSACAPATATSSPSLPSPTPLPPSPTPTSTPTPIPTTSLTALVWTSDPQVPILTYHQFADDIAKRSSPVKVRKSDFRAELESLYAAGYSLVSLREWLNGQWLVPPGRRPLILSMDDLFYNNQIGLTPEGEPHPNTGIGILWQFYKEHPDFGFHLALFANLGDKLYADPGKPDWEMKLAQTIVWCLEHGAEIYNHTYTHADLSQSDATAIRFELSQNDQYLRQLLEKAGRSDLASTLGNMLALPYGKEPPGLNERKVIYNYTNPEGRRLEAVFYIDFIIRPGYFEPASPTFDPLHIPRIVATQEAVRVLSENAASFPAPLSCEISIEVARQNDAERIEERIRQAIQDGHCPDGRYFVAGLSFDMRSKARVTP